MSTQIEINKQLVNYLQTVGYRHDPIIDTLVKETKALGDVAQMQIAPEQGQFLQMIIKQLKRELIFSQPNPSTYLHSHFR